MNYIDFVVRNKHIESRHNSIIADNTDYMMRFAFDEGWAGYPDKTVLVLDNEGKIWELHLTGGETEVKLPKFIGRKLLAVGVTATAGDGEISSDALSLRVNPSIRTGASEVIGAPESGAKDLLEEYREKYETLIAELQAAIDSTYLGVTGATVGQTVRITAVDEGGKPTEWEAVEFPEHVQSDYEQNDSSSKDYIKNRPCYEATETTDIAGTSITIDTSVSSVTHDFIPLQVGQEWKVTTNTGSEFTAVVQENEQGEPYLGSPDTTSGSYPFYIRANEAVCNSSWVLMQNITSLTLTCLSGTYTQGVIKKIDPKFLPDVGSSLVVNLTMDDSGNITADKTLAEIKAASDDGKVVDAKIEGTIVPLGYLTDSEAIFTLTNANSSEVSTASLTCTSDNVWSMSQDGFDASTTLGISGAAAGQTVTIKAVDAAGIPTEWEATDKMDKVNPTGTGSFSLNRKSGTIVGTNSHAEGYNPTASGHYSHAEGYKPTASGNFGSHSEGNGTTASGKGSHAQGNGTTASGDYSHAQGISTTASGNYGSHAEGYNTTASGASSHAEGSNTKAASVNQHAQGKFNIEDSSNTYADIIGNGASNASRSNAATVDWSGNAWYAGDVYTGSTSGTNKDEGSKKLATEEYVDSAVSGLELINEISTTEFVTSITIDQDADGNAFSLKKMIILMTLPKTTNEAGEEQTNAGYAYYAVNGMRPAWQSPSNGWNNALFLWTIEALGDYYTVTCFKDGENTAQLWHSDIFKSEGAFSTITKFEWRLFNGTFGWNNTNFKVYGVRA